MAKLRTTWPVQRVQLLLSPGQLFPHRDVGLVLPILLFQEKPEIRILFMLATNLKFKKKHCVGQTKYVCRLNPASLQPLN